MSNPQDRLPVQVDPFRMAEAGRIFEGDVPLRQMKRLQPLLAAAPGNARVRLAFGIDEMGVRYLEGTVHAELQILCQRCLEPMPWTVDVHFSLGLLHPGEDESVAGVHEPLVVEEVPMHLFGLLEDEILLALPQIPRHELDACPARHWVAPATDTNEAADTRSSPFSVLAKMKKTQTSNEE